jgi:senataxin
MNVALTRAKSSLFILGNAPTLERSNADWKEIVNNARTRSLLTDVSYPLTSVTSVHNFASHQADASYFTEPNPVQSARPASPSKANKQRPVPKPIEPTDLITPQSLAESVRAKPQSQNISSTPIGPTSIQTTAGPSRIPVQHPLPKRPFVEEISEFKPNPPLRKRPKKDKGSIFIPKKPKP